MELRNKRAITLISLVVTIIVLVVLSGVLVASLKGENGIIKKTEEAVHQTHDATDVEKIKLSVQAYVISKRKGNKSNLADIINEEDWCEKATYNETDKTAMVVLKKCKDIYQVTENGKITSLGTYVEDGITVNSNDGLDYFLSSDETDITIKLENDIELSKELVITEKNVTIYGMGHTIKYSNSYDGTLFNVKSGAGLTIDNVNINGGNVWIWDSTELQNAIEKSKAGQSIYINGNVPTIAISKGKIITNTMFQCEGNLTINNTKISNCYFNGTNNNVVYANSVENTIPEITLNNTKITHCVGNTGLAIYSKNSKIDLLGNSEISDNYCTGGYGGIFDLESSSGLNINGAQIKNNIMIAARGAVCYVNGTSKVILNNGNINGNLALRQSSSSSASMIECVHQGKFEMNGGEITNNTGLLAGAISVRWPDNKYDIHVTLNSGTIKNNSVHIPTSFSNPTALFTRGNAVIASGMTVHGNITVNDSYGNLTNNGNIVGNVSITNANSIVTNNGIIEGDVNATLGTFINNGTVIGLITEP